MAKELPYFKFTCDEWLTGDITLEEDNIQGIFINICAYYWKKNCSVTIAKLRQRYKRVKEHNWNILLEQNYIKVDEYFNASITFLDEQWEELLLDKSKKSASGKLGAKKRWHNHSAAKKVPMAKHGNKEVEVDKEEERNKEKDNKEKYNPLNDCPFWKDKEVVEAFNSWQEVRTKKKCSNSDRAVRRYINDLMKLSGGNIQKAIAIFDYSADGGWTKLYDPNLKTNKTNSSRPELQEL